ncbi:NAD(P)/FAD-dependent oxidoreductase [Williamsia sp. CHRR-6]|uniref:dihydrolipoyl dehydrogenase family protein n=1 Tax=Williamsia sp. CHRR-6 TaxID=2835871 RepID=UPI001BDA7817|nr:NAD(P)/FAD-dependent oxidoreductase [Williamsia sp. CHRR-6]MBT0565842.1 NAD(P)/FAD-dependent oxidoreductase [Williamsia sp. CHRR-6]
MTTDTATPDADIIVIGGGPAGEVAAQFAISGSDRTAIIVEAELLGGECSYWACMPSKALLRPLEVAAAARSLAGFEVSALDSAALLARRDQWVSHYDDAGQRTWATGAGITVVDGRGRIDGERRVVVDDGGAQTVLTAGLAVVLATGSVVAVPDALAATHPWTSRDATGVIEIPQSLVVIGGGVVACEAAIWMSALGSRVTMLVRSRVLTTLDDFVGDAVAEGLRAAGVAVRTGVVIDTATRPEAADTGVGRVHGGPVTITLADGQTLTAAEVLVATGRRPAVEGLGLDTIGVGDPRDLAAHDWLYAVGDVSFGPMLTHWGKYQARLVGQRIAARAEGATPPPQRPDVPVPQAVFTDPPVGSVGLTERAAGRSGRAHSVITQPMRSASGIGLLRDDAGGTAQIVVDEASRTIVGATFVGPEAGELIHSATVAIVGRLTVDDLWHAVPSYPTGSEIWLRLLEKYFGY